VNWRPTGTIWNPPRLTSFLRRSVNFVSDPGSGGGTLGARRNGSCMDQSIRVWQPPVAALDTAGIA